MRVMDRVRQEQEQRRAQEDNFSGILGTILGGIVESSAPLAAELDTRRAAQEEERARREREAQDGEFIKELVMNRIAAKDERDARSREEFLRSGVGNATDLYGNTMTDDDLRSMSQYGGGVMEMGDGRSRFVDEGVIKRFVDSVPAPEGAPQAVVDAMKNANVVKTDDGYGIARRDAGGSIYTQDLAEPGVAQHFLNPEQRYNLESQGLLPESEEFANRRREDAAVELAAAQAEGERKRADAAIKTADADMKEAAVRESVLKMEQELAPAKQKLEELKMRAAEAKSENDIKISENEVRKAELAVQEQQARTLREVGQQADGKISEGMRTDAEQYMKSRLQPVRLDPTDSDSIEVPAVLATEARSFKDVWVGTDKKKAFVNALSAPLDDLTEDRTDTPGPVDAAIITRIINGEISSDAAKAKGFKEAVRRYEEIMEGLRLEASGWVTSINIAAMGKASEEDDLDFGKPGGE